MMSDRQGYAVLVSLYTPEEAEVMASALRAEGIDAFVGNRHHANVDWGWTIALGGLQVMVPTDRFDDAKAAMRTRWREALENPEGDPVRRRDRWKVWLVMGAAWLLPWGVMSTAHTLDSDMNMRAVQVSSDDFNRQARAQLSFSAPAGLRPAEREAALVDYCLDNPLDSAIAPAGPLGDVVQCADILRRNGPTTAP
jgi:hypothetical protein